MLTHIHAPAQPGAPLKVAHITTIDLSLRYLLLNQLTSIRAAGYQVSGIAAPGPDVPALEAAGLHFIPLPMTRNVTPLADLLALWRLVRLLRRERFTIVHGHTPKAELLGQLAARLAGVPVVVDTFRGIYYRPDMHPLWRKLFIGMARLAAGCADRVLSQSQEALQMALDEGICPPHKIQFLGNGIDIQRFNRSRLEPGQLDPLRREFNLAAGQPVVGFVGRLVREKGISELLQAAQQIKQQWPEVKFLLVGPIDADKPDALTPAVADQYGLGQACVFTGLRQDMPQLYALMDIFVLPSHRESFPRSPMEASAMAVPCVVTDIPGCREAVIHGQNGLLTPLADADALTAAISRLLSHPEHARRMGHQGRRLAEERFDERLIFAKVIAVYAELLAQKGLTIAQPVGLD
ncbi:MAG: glycosyltransferase family 4 protein [Anaerolineae bacterium]|nr:glycosyltransferase family 4 protein [Anaerolineae bacterium]